MRHRHMGAYYAIVPPPRRRRRSDSRGYYYSVVVVIGIVVAPLDAQAPRLEYGLQFRHFTILL